MTKQSFTRFHVSVHWSRLFYLAFFFVLTINSRIYGDTLELKGFDEKIDAKVVEFNDEFVTVIIPKGGIGSINIKSELDDKFPDTVFLSANGKENKVVCKIVKITKKPGSITMQIPRRIISAVKMSLHGDEHEINSNRKDAFTASKEERGYSPVDTETLRKQIKEELKRVKEELRMEFEESQGKKNEAIEEKIIEELTLEFERKQQINEETFEAENYGRVAGRMLFKGKPLQGCQVKIQVLERWGILGGVKKGIHFETITDENGVYNFENVPPGGYKLYWKPPSESSWIRRLQMEPDIYVEYGERYYLPDRETNIKLLN